MNKQEDNNKQKTNQDKNAEAKSAANTDPRKDMENSEYIFWVN